MSALVAASAVLSGCAKARPQPSAPPSPTSTSTPSPTMLSTPTPTPTPQPTPTLVPACSLEIRGVDISTLPRVEDNGGIFYDDTGQPRDLLHILADHAINYVRLRLWHTPAHGYDDLAHVKGMAARIKNAGMGFLLDFHYSDTWADPGTQTKPAAWSSHTLSQLTTDVYNHTLDVCTALKNAGATPDMIQIGNEITNSMLWPEGRITNNNFANLATLLKSAYNAVKACSSSIQVAVHIRVDSQLSVFAVSSLSVC